MRQRRFYTLAFLLVVAGGLVAARLVFQRIGPVALPEMQALAGLPALIEDLNLAALLPRPRAVADTPTPEPTIPGAATQPTPVATSEVAPPLLLPPSTTPSPGLEAPETPTAPPAVAPTATQRPTATPAPATPTPTATVAPPPSQALPFVAAGPVRHGADNCPGPSIRGTIRDRAGNLLPGVRVWRYDQWGNEQTVESKSGAADVGQYDFPLGDTPNVHYVQIVDGSGAPISALVEVQHRQGAGGDAPCHWIDWIRNS